METKATHVGRWAFRGAPWRGYAVAVAGTAAATLLHLGVARWVGEISPFTTFYPVVIAAAVIGGARAGVVATILSALVADFFFLPPFHVLWPLSAAQLTGIGLFIIVNLVLSIVGGRMRAAYGQSRLQAAALASVANAIIVTDREGAIRWVNPAFERLTGYDAAEVAGQNPRLLKSGKQDNAFYKQLWDTILAGRVWHGEMVNKRKDGSFYTEEMTITPVKGFPGRNTHFIAVKHDVTARKETEARMLGLSQRRAEDLAAMERLHEVSLRFARHEDLHSLLDAILDAAIAVVGGTKGFVQLLDSASGQLTLAAQRGFGAAFVESFNHKGPGPTACSTAMQTKQRVIVEDITRNPIFETTPRALQLKLAEGVRAVVCTPLLTRTGQVLGVLSALFPAPHRPSERDLGYLDLLARQAADFIEHAQVQEGLREEARLARLRADVTQALQQPAAMKEILQKVAALLVEGLDAAFARVWTLDASGQTLDLQASAGLYTHLNGAHSRVPVGQLKIGLIAQERRPMVTNQVIGDPHVPNQDWARREGLVAFAGFPLLLGGQLLGVVALFARHPFSKAAADTFGTIASTLALAIGRKEAEEALRTRNAELVRSESQFRTLADSIPNMAWSANGEGYITWFNRRWYEYTGTTPQQAEGWGWQSVHDPERLAEVLERWKGSIASGEPLEVEFPLRGADGRFRWFLTRTIPLRDEAGKIVRWFGTSTDVSEIREAREVLARGKEQLERLVAERTARLRETVEELEGFSYSIVHDMRAPLRAMQSFSTLAQEACEGCLRAEGLDYFQRIRTASSRLDKLVTDALNYSMVVREELPLVPVEVGKLLRGIVETYPNLHPPQVEIQIDLDALLVRANESALTQVLSNLLGNAVKFVAPGVHPRVRVWAEEGPSAECASRSKAGEPRPAASGAEPVPVNGLQNAALDVPYSAPGTARIWIEDNGIGIPPSAHARIFGMFQRMHRAEEYPGTGIGLAIVRKAIERMCGRVGVESAPGHGSRFWIELPRAKPGDPPQMSGRMAGLAMEVDTGWLI
jgi:PAS domain S-box-containing protein